MGLDTVEIIISVEEYFDIKISDADAIKMSTPGDIYEFVIAALEQKRNVRMPEIAKQAAYSKIVDIIANQLGVDRSEVTKTAKLVEELGADR